MADVLPNLLLPFCLHLHCRIGMEAGGYGSANVCPLSRQSITSRMAVRDASSSAWISVSSRLR